MPPKKDFYVVKGMFISQHLTFLPDLSIRQIEVKDAFQDFIGEPRDKFSAVVIGDLYDLISRLGATRDDKKGIFYGVGLNTLA